MKSSNKLFVVLTAASALSVFIGVNIVYAATSNKSDTIQTSVDGNGQYVTEVRNVKKFNGIHVSGLANVIVEKGKVNQVNISADQNLFPYIKIAVKNNQLSIGSKKDIVLNPSQMMNVIVTTNQNDLSKIATSGKVTLSEKNINTDNVSVDTSGKTKINLSGQVKKIDFNLAGKSEVTLCNMKSSAIHFNAAGKSDIHLCGNAAELKIKSAGKTTLDGKDFTTGSLSILGAGKIDITSRVLKSIQVSAFGKVNVNYYGNPKMIDKTFFGDVVVKKMDN